MKTNINGISFIIPAYNEEDMLIPTINHLHKILSNLKIPFEIIVVNDGSIDGTRQKAESLSKVRLINHPVNSGYGKSIKTGIDVSCHSFIGIVDADGTYDIDQLPVLIKKMEEGFDMVVLSRKNILKIDKPLKRFFRKILLLFINLFISAKIEDPNSGFRVFRKELVMTFYPFLCDTFSFTTSITIFAMGEGYFVSFVPGELFTRKGESKVRHFRDSLRMIQLVFQGITYFNPLKFIFILVLMVSFCVGLPSVILSAYGWGNFANLFALIGTSSMLLIGLGVMVDIIRISNTIKLDKKNQ